MLGAQVVSDVVHRLSRERSDRVGLHLQEGLSLGFERRHPLRGDEPILGRVETGGQQIGVGELAHGLTVPSGTLLPVSRDPEETIAQIAHAFDPSSWKKRSLVIASVTLPFVLGVTVLQRAIVADSTAEWIITALHGAVVAVVVPVLLRIAWRDWNAAQAERGVPE